MHPFIVIASTISNVTDAGWEALTNGLAYLWSGIVAIVKFCVVFL